MNTDQTSILLQADGSVKLTAMKGYCKPRDFKAMRGEYLEVI